MMYAGDYVIMSRAIRSQSPLSYGIDLSVRAHVLPWNLK